MQKCLGGMSPLRIGISMPTNGDTSRGPSTPGTPVDEASRSQAAHAAHAIQSCHRAAAATRSDRPRVMNNAPYRPAQDATHALPPEAAGRLPCMPAAWGRDPCQPSLPTIPANDPDPMSQSESPTDTAPTDREATRLAWARAATGDAGFELHRASIDAGFRSYWRGAPADGGPAHAGATPSSTALNSAAPNSVIVMDSPPAQEDVRPWLRIRELLDAGGVRVPRVLAQDVHAGFLLLEDLGADTYLHVIGLHNADALLDAAVTQLLTLQAIDCPDDLPAYDEALLARELHLFDEWYLGRHLGLSLDGGDLETLERVYRCLIDSALAQPQVLVHRDYMPRNLMPVADGPAVLDFQDAVRGPIAYDPTSLFKDAFLSWPEDRVDAWLDRYHARAAAAGLPVPALPRFRRDADLMGVQRHLKVIGIFARLHHRDAKPKYLADVPRFFAYLDGVLPKYPELAPLAQFIEHRVRPALAELARAHEGLA